MAMPGICIEECASNQIGVTLYNSIVDMAALMIGLNEKKLFEMLKEYPYIDNMIVSTDTVMLNVMEAFTTAILGMSGMFVGYNNEEVDDTSTPPPLLPFLFYFL